MNSKSQKNNKEANKISIQMLPITIASLTVSAINGIIGFLAVYFFAPIWIKIVAWWNKNEIH
jgi:hypothetical protein